jgi:DNA-binding transcriptional MocR family regulator
LNSSSVSIFTPSFSAFTNFDPGSLPIAYTDHAGKPELRDLIASEATSLEAGDVILTAGAAAGWSADVRAERRSASRRRESGGR